MRNKLLSKGNAKKQFRHRQTALQQKGTQQIYSPQSTTKAQEMTHILTVIRSFAAKKIALRLKPVHLRRARLLKRKTNKRSYFFRKKLMLLQKKQKEAKDTNKQNIFRKTSEDYFRKLSEEQRIVEHSHSRKVSWKQEDSFRVFDKTKPPTEFVKDF